MKVPWDPPRQAGHPLSDTEQELWTLKVWREEEATFTEHPAWSWAFSGKKDQAIRCPWSPPQGGGTCLGGHHGDGRARQV